MPTIKLTKSHVETLPLPKKGRPQAFYFDTELKGFGIRLSAHTRSFFAERRVNGKTRRVTIGRYPELTVYQAKEQAKKYLGEMAMGTDINAEKKEQKTKSLTLREVYTTFLEGKTLKPITIRDYNRIMAVTLADWQPQPWSTITSQMIAKKHSEIGKVSGNAYANLTMRCLRSVLNFAIATYRDSDDRPLISENPVYYLTRTKTWFKIKRRTNHIKPHQLKDWFVAAYQLDNTTMRDYLLFLLFTGLRRNEVANLKWDDIDLKDKSFVIIDPKNTEPFFLPLSDFLHELLINRKKEASSPHVFPADSESGHIEDPRKALWRIAEISGVDVDVHDLRRTFMTIGESLDISRYAIKALVDHRTGSGDVTGGYIQISTERLRKPVKEIADFILSEAKLETSGNVIEMSVSHAKQPS